MPRNAKPPDKRTVEAAEMLNNPTVTITVEQVMRAHWFTDEEAKDKTLQQRVRRLAHEMKQQKPPPEVVCEAGSALSPLTGPSKDLATDSDSAKASRLSAKEKAAGVKEICRTASQAQQKKVNDKKLREVDELALKEATKMCTEEKQKEKDGKSAKEVCKILNNEHGTSIAAATVH